MKKSDKLDNDFDLLDRLLYDKIGNFKGSNITPRMTDRGPLSLQQERLWFLHELTSGAAAYNICSVFRLCGKLNISALRDAFRATVERHAALRTAIHNRDGQIEQVFESIYTPLAECLDWTWRGEGEVDKRALQQLLQNEATNPFDLASGQPFRVILVKLDEHHHVLALSMHHIISDAWSLAILMREVAELYAAFTHGHEAALRSLPINYLDYVAWQRENLSEREARELAYWRKELADLPLLDLPTDLPRPSIQTFNGATLSLQVPAHTVRGLQRLATDERTTLFCVLMAALQVLLGRHARQQDVAIGTSVAGRELPETEGMVGFFTNMVVIRGRLEEDLSFRTLVRADTVTIRDALDHATLAYNRLVEGLKVLSDYSRNPLFQVAFTLLNAPVAPPPLGTLKAERLLSQEAARFDLELFLHEVDGALSGVFTFNTDLFVKASVDRLIEQWLVLLADAAASPDKPVSHLAMMHNTLSLLTVPIKTSEPWILPVHEAFLAHAQRQPEAVALWLGEQSLSYGELETQARSITHRLIEAGVRADQSVGLWFEPGFSMIAAMLGTLMAGGGYVPLQPGYPVEHIAYILKDSGVDIVVSDANLAWPVFNFDGRVLLMGQTDAPGPCTLPETQPGHLAYIIYTSGSTGRPKGVEISHTNVARLFSSCDHLFDFDSKDVWTFFHSYAFDFSVWEIWGALVHGASLVIVPPELARTPDVFYELLCERKVTVLSQTPSAFRQLMAAEEAQPREADLALRYLVFGGEALNIGGLAPWMDRHGDDAPVLVNMYGITETTVHVTLRRITYADLRGPASSVIIGTPLPDLCIRLLDPYGKPVPPGMTGEIYVGGAGVARGYRRQPELTAQRFFKDAAGLRLYRSGDLARINAWGELEYRGRTDTQVKLRGYRIEIGEIESALKSHAAIADAVVVVQGLLEAARLVAYVRLHRETVGDSRGAVKDWLPSFDMIYTEAEAEDDELDIVGWNDSYDNQPLPAEHIRLWRDETLARLRGLQPTRVLELGTGSGMLLLRLAGSVECYHGLDFSTRAVARLTKKVAARGYQQVRLEHREASDQAGLSGDFDLVVLNSTAQYFPSAAYFLDVLEQAMQRLQPGGHLFVGDLRHLGLLRNFHASRLLHRRPEGSTRTSLRELLAKLCASEKELLVDPDFFFHWAAVRGDISGIKILPKERGGLNELTAYRYDAVIVTGTPTSPSPYKLVDADGPEPTWEGRPLMVRGVPNARLGATDAFLSWLDADGETFATPTVQDWDAWSQVKREPDPAALVAAWRAQAGVAVLYWATGDNSGSFDLAVAASNSELPRIGIPTETTVEFGRFFNTPSKSIDRPALAPMLHQHLSTRLPGYMLPAAYVVLETFPLTVNGKLNVKTLPAPGEAAETAPGEQFAIWSATERKIGEIWKEVLQLQYLDLHANFFECGGHSLLATQVISRLRATFAVELPLRSLFDKPTITEFSAMLDELNPQAAPLPAIVPTTRGDLLPLSFAQQRFWFMEQIDQGQIGSYNVSLGLRLRGKLDRTALRAAITAIIARHEVLRTRFVQREGVPMQQIEPAWTLNMAEIDFSGQPSVEAEAALAALVASQAHARFDLAAAPPVRFALVYMAEREHVLQLSLHHAISDGWSLGVMVREFSEHYTAFLEGRAVRLPELPLQFGDVAVWQRSEMTSTRLESLLARWKRRLQGAPSRLALPLEQAPHTDAPRLGKIIRFAFDSVQTRCMKAFAEANSATLFMVLAASYAALLARYSGTRDVVIGTPIANRQRKELEGLIGCFLNTLALRIQPGAGMSGRELLAHVRERVLEAYEWQDAPFEAVVSSLHPERSRDTHALFQVMLILQNMPLGMLSLPELEVEPMQSEESVASFDLSLSFIEIEDTSGEACLQGMLEYDADKFLHASVDRFAAQLKSLLEGIVVEPERAVETLGLLAPGEREYLLETLNDTAHEVQRERCLHEMVSEQAARTPGKIAVRDLAGELSYAELEARANAVAWALHELGIGPEAIVGLCTERNLAMVVGLLGILKAGAAYLPLDPAYPRERLDFMMADARARVLVTQNTVREVVSFTGPTLLLEQLDRVQTCPASGVVPANLAYIIYTSGSTGTPKGVMTPHIAIVNYLSWSRTTYAPGEQGSIPMTPSYAFDGCMTPLFAPLLSGRCMQLLPRDDVLSQMRHVLERRENLTMIGCGPAHLEALRHVLEPDRLRGQVQTIVTGGEPVQASTLTFWRRHAPTTCLYNEYGPTETTVGCCAYEVIPTSPWTGPLPIGRPIWNVRLYVLDELLQPLPVGIPGDLYVAGSGLARGYLGQPTLTAQRFVPNPFSMGDRLYHTGDRARWRTDDTLEYLGREDNQVKLRGFRIELGEVEDAMRQHPRVLDAVAMVREGSQGLRCLVGYVVGQGEGLERELSAFLGQRLPDFMVPSLYVPLPALPLSVNGKVDRRALSLPDWRLQVDTAASSAGGRALSTTEQRLAAIWKEVLGHPVHDPQVDFFDTGGDSLTAVKLIFLIEREFTRTLPLSSLFNKRTLAAQAVAVLESGSAATNSAGALVPINIRKTAPSVVFVHDISGQILSYRPLAEALVEASVYGLQSLPPSQGGANSIAGMAAAYAEAILIRVPGPLVLVGHSFGAQMAAELARVLITRGRPPALLAVLDGLAEVDLTDLAIMPRDDIELLDYMVRTLELSLERRIDLDAAQLRVLPESKRADWIATKVSEAGVVPKGTPPKQVMQLFAIYKNNLESLRTYRPGRLACPVTVWRTAALAERGDLGWGAYANGKVSLLDAAGEHVSMLKPPHVKTLALSLSEAIAITGERS